MSIRKKLVCLATMAAVSVTGLSVSGCYGKNALTNKLHKAYGSLGDKWISSVVYFLTGHIVMTFCLFADFIIFNTIEFWTGSNPLAMGDTYEETDANGSKLLAKKNDDGTLSVNILDVHGNASNFKLERDGNKISVFDTNNNLIAMHWNGN
ncbi:MAG: DUF3332 domain-containing protein [Chitinispirillia bacterium]|nr:DUF3332 domain-containing protein [Chitinispirillia bacterium]MCL2267630.1 DUF3332 domain-containing protein [Chitinispirillia bacterium]